MNRLGHATSAAALVAIAACLSGCSWTTDAATSAHGATVVIPDPVPQASPAIAHGSSAYESAAHGGSGRGTPPAGGLPADWPGDIPVPEGTVTGSTGAAGRWTVQLLAAGSAEEVLASARAFYAAAGFTAATDSALSRGRRHLTLVVESRDHSAAETILLIAVVTS